MKCIMAGDNELPGNCKGDKTAMIWGFEEANTQPKDSARFLESSEGTKLKSAAMWSKGLTPTSSLKIVAPSDHQSTALVYPLA